MNGMHSHSPESGEHQHEAAPSRAIEIAGMGDYTRILEMLRAEGLLEREVERVRREYSLDEIGFVTDRDRELFTVIDLYDPGTARHCRETYRIGKEKMEKEIVPGVSFERLLRQKENIRLEQFYRACLLHDIGKVSVPRAVIRHHMGDNAMLGCLHPIYHQLYLANKIPASLGLAEDATDDVIDEALRTHHARAIYFVPAKEVLSPEALAEVRHYGFTGEETMMEIIQTHEASSGRILAGEGFSIESDLAAHHHNYSNEPLVHPIATGALHLSVDAADVAKDMLHMADVTQALSSPERQYLDVFGMPKAMKTIVEHAEEGKIAAYAAYLWLLDDLAKYEAQRGTEGQAEPSDDIKNNLADVRAFLEKMREQLSGESGVEQK